MKKTFSIHWSKQATENLQQIYDYIRQDSPASAEKLVDEIIARTDMLKRHPYLYQIEPLLTDIKKNYRSIIVKKNYKVIYKIDTNIIMILRVFHTRQNPTKLKHINY